MCLVVLQGRWAQTLEKPGPPLATQGLLLLAPREGEAETEFGYRTVSTRRCVTSASYPNEIASKYLSAFWLLLVELDRADFEQVPLSMS